MGRDDNARRGTAAEFPPTTKVGITADFTRRDRTRLAQTEAGLRYRHVAAANIETRKLEGWELDEQKSGLAGHVVMKIPAEAVQQRNAELEELNRINEASAESASATSKVGPTAFERTPQ